MAESRVNVTVEPLLDTAAILESFEAVRAAHQSLADAATKAIEKISELSPVFAKLAPPSAEEIVRGLHDYERKNGRIRD